MIKYTDRNDDDDPALTIKKERAIMVITILYFKTEHQDVITAKKKNTLQDVIGLNSNNEQN